MPICREFDSRRCSSTRREVHSEVALRSHEVEGASPRRGFEGGCRSAASAEVLRGPGCELAQRLLGAGTWLRRVDDELLVGLGVGGERIPLERDLADDRMVVPPCAASFDGDVGPCPPLAELRVTDREVAYELGEARIVRLPRCLHPQVRDD